MKFLVNFLLIALLSFAACLYLPWWSIAVVSFLVVVIIPLKIPKAFLCGFLAIFILWGGLTLWISAGNQHLLANKMSVIILQTTNAYLLILSTAAIGGIIAGFAALSGALMRKIRIRRR